MSVYLAPRPTTYCGIDMRSRLEARFAAFLDSMPAFCRWQYEPRAFADKRGQYLPDFLTRFVASAGEVDIYIEVKPTPEASLRFITSHQMEIIWSSDPKAHLMVAYDDGGRFEVLACSPEDREWVAL